MQLLLLPPSHHKWTLGTEQRPGTIGQAGGSIPFAGCKDDARVHFCIYRQKSCSYCSTQKKIISMELQINGSSALVDPNTCET